MVTQRNAASGWQCRTIASCNDDESLVEVEVVGARKTLDSVRGANCALAKGQVKQ